MPSGVSGAFRRPGRRGGWQQEHLPSFVCVLQSHVRLNRLFLAPALLGSRGMLSLGRYVTDSRPDDGEAAQGHLLKPLSPARHGVRLNRVAHSIGNVARLVPSGKAASTWAISMSVKWISPALAFSLAR